MKTIKLSIEQAKELYNTNKEFRNTILHEFTDNELGIEPILRDWEDLDFKKTYRPNIKGGIYTDSENSYKNSHLNVPSQKHANSMIAFAKLSILMADLGDECVNDWNDEIDKYVIDCYKNAIITGVSYHSHYFLVFETESIRDAFLDKHERLIKDYFMID